MAEARKLNYCKAYGSETFVKSCPKELFTFRLNMPECMIRSLTIYKKIIICHIALHNQCSGEAACFLCGTN
jgi:hypothetical protein